MGCSSVFINAKVNTSYLLLGVSEIGRMPNVQPSANSAVKGALSLTMFPDAIIKGGNDICVALIIKPRKIPRSNGVRSNMMNGNSQ